MVFKYCFPIYAELQIFRIAPQFFVLGPDTSSLVSLLASSGTETAQECRGTLLQATTASLSRSPVAALVS